MVEVVLTLVLTVVLMDVVCCCSVVEGSGEEESKPNVDKGLNPFYATVCIL